VTCVSIYLSIIIIVIIIISLLLLTLLFITTIIIIIIIYRPSDSAIFENPSWTVRHSNAVCVADELLFLAFLLRSSPRLRTTQVGHEITKRERRKKGRKPEDPSKKISENS
jgi:hypothetical protein